MQGSVGGFVYPMVVEAWWLHKPFGKIAGQRGDVTILHGLLFFLNYTSENTSITQYAQLFILTNSLSVSEKSSGGWCRVRFSLP